MTPSSHRYGPHRPEDAPNAVTVLAGGTRSRTQVRTEVHPIPLELVRQRYWLNTLAHYGAILAGVLAPCPHDWVTSSREGWAVFCRRCGVRRD